LFHQYKAGIGALLREGAIVVTEDSLTLVPEADRQPLPAEPYSGKSPRGWAAPDAAVLFVGNLAFNVDKMELAAAIEQVRARYHDPSRSPFPTSSLTSTA